VPNSSRPASSSRRRHPPRLELRDDVLERDRAVLEAAGYEASDGKLGLYETTAVPEPNPKITVRAVNDRAGWVKLVTRAFAQGHEPDDESRRSATISAAAAHGLFIAEVDGVPAGAGAVAITADVAYLYSGAVLPHFRCRGVHRALLHARAKFGADRGAARTAIKTFEDTASAESAKQAGFERTAILRRLHR